MNGQENGWSTVGPHKDFERRPTSPPEMLAFLRGNIDGRLTRIDDFLEIGEVASARALIAGWVKELRAGEWPD